MAKNIPQSVYKPIAEVIPSDVGYIIRPSTNLRGQRNGFKWSPTESGLLRTFLAMHVKILKTKDTGRKLKLD